MSSVTGTSNSSSLGASLLGKSGGTQAMGKDDFLKLLVTQLQNQDPLNPSDPTEFTAQLAQFSSLEQLFAVNDSLTQMASSKGDMERLSALSLLGREVTAGGGTFRLGKEGTTLGYRLEASAQEVTVHVLDSAGRAVASIPAKETGAGEHFFPWDGKNQYGEAVNPGEYSLVVTATAGKNSAGKEEVVPASALVRGTVTGVDLSSSGSVLVSTAGEFQLKDVVRVGG